MMTAQQQLAMKRFAANPQAKKQISGYLEQEVKQWSPEKIILKTYDLFIVSCKQKDIVRMNRVLSALINALNFEYQESATRLYRLYEYCQTCISKRDYDEAQKIIQGLRDSWAEAFEIK